MPPLPDPQPTILRAVPAPSALRAAPSPSRDGLALEVLTAREIGYLGQIVGIDIPLIEVESGWGDVVTINTGPGQL